MNRFFLFLLMTTLFNTDFSYAQYDLNENKIWAFPKGLGLDFSSGIATPINTNMTSIEAAATVCDDSGHLLFYTNGATVWDHNGNPMPNANPIYPSNYPFVNLGFGPTESTTQGALIIPMIGNPRRFYLLSLTDIIQMYAAPQYTLQGHLFYSVIDMTLNGGLGDVVTSQQWIQIDTGLSEKMIAVRGNNCDIWIVVHSNSYNIFKSYHVTSEGIDPNPVISTTGITGYTPYQPPTHMINCFYSSGQMCASPDGKKLATAYMQGNCVELHDFDATTGKVSNSIVVDTESRYGVAFSPDNSKLYTCGIYRNSPAPALLQFDLSVPTPATIRASAVRLVTASGPPTTPLAIGISQLQLGPDGKIYFFANSNPYTVGIIQNPDLQGLACNLIPYGPVFPNANPSNFHGTFSNTFIKIKNDSVYSIRLDTSICSSFAAKLSLLAATHGKNYLWNDGSTDKVLYTQQEGKYWVSYQNECTWYVDTFIIRKEPEIEQHILGPDTIRCYADEQPIFLSVSDHEQGNILWSNGNTGNSIAVNSAGTYWVAIEDANCILNDTILVIEKYCNCGVQMPSAFTPNEDGLNDIFRPIISQNCPLQSFTLRIYNRWGELLFTTQNAAFGWDGTYKGIIADVGVYQYQVNYITADSDKKHFLKGDITLIR